MKKSKVLLGAVVLILAGAVAVTVPASAADRSLGELEPEVAELLAETPPDEMVTVIVRMQEQPAAAVIAPIARRAGDVPAVDRLKVIRELKDESKKDQAPVLQLIEAEIAQGDAEAVTPYWIFNGMAVTAKPEVIEQIAELAIVDVVAINHEYVLNGSILPTTEWNIEQSGALELWARGLTGEGVVIAALDTGADIDGIPNIAPSPIADSWRGGTNSWFDPYENTTRPIDLDGHGTSVIGLVVGGGDNTNFGMAPDAQWIAAKVFDNNNTATAEAIHAAFQWVLDPDDDPTTDDGADIVNNSWGGGFPGCDDEFAADIEVLRAVGVLPVWSAGNLGPTADINSSPANLPGAFSVGAIDDTNGIWSRSSRGRNACDNSTYPSITAPGDGVQSYTRFGQPVQVTGTSFAAPHVTGAAALLLQADPDIDLLQLETALRQGAIDLGAAGPDNTFGNGALAIGNSANLLANASLTVTVADTTGAPAPTGVTVILYSTGPDAHLGTADDVVIGQATTDVLGTVSFPALPAGHYRVMIDDTTLPAGVLSGNPAHLDVFLAAGASETIGPLVVVVTNLDEEIHISTRNAGQLPNGKRFKDEDILVWDGHTLEFFIDGSDLGLATADINAFTLIEDDVALVSFDRTTNIASIGEVRDTDIVRIQLTSTGRRTAGTMSLFLDGSDVGLDSKAADIDGLVWDNGSLLVSTVGSVTLPGLGRVRDEDVSRLDNLVTGEDSQGTWTQYFDGSDFLLTSREEDLDAIGLRDGQGLAFSTVGTMSSGAFTAEDHDVIGCDDVSACQFSLLLSGQELGLEDEDIDAIDLDH